MSIFAIAAEGVGYLLLALVGFLFIVSLEIGFAIFGYGAYKLVHYFKSVPQAKRHNRSLILPIFLICLGLVIGGAKLAHNLDRYSDNKTYKSQAAKASRIQARKINFPIFEATSVPASIESKNLLFQQVNESQNNAYPLTYLVRFDGNDRQGYQLEQYKQPGLTIGDEACNQTSARIGKITCIVIAKNKYGGEIVYANGTDRGEYYTDYRGTRIRLTEGNNGGLSNAEAIQILQNLREITVSSLSFERKTNVLSYLW